jgi:peptidoglycan/xylan/chitin deacetylase (PgdA/CDA1 family)
MQAPMPLTWTRGGAKRALVTLMAYPPLCRVVSWRAARAGRRIALTFDDGPHAAYTPRVLDLLAEHGVRATFYVLGEHVEKHPALLRRVVAAGHEIGLHGYDHSLDGLPRQMERTRAIVRELGAEPATVRPPRGRMSLGLLRWSIRNGLPVVLWSFDLEDSRRHEGKALVRRPLREIAAGDILLQHDDNPVCPADLPDLIQAASQAHLQPTRVSELLRLRPVIDA